MGTDEKKEKAPMSCSLQLRIRKGTAQQHRKLLDSNYSCQTPQKHCGHIHTSKDLGLSPHQAVMRHPQSHPTGQCQRRPRREPKPSYQPSNNRPQITTHLNPKASVETTQGAMTGHSFPSQPEKHQQRPMRSQNPH